MATERLATTTTRENEARLLQMGDVFTSPKLAYGYRDYQRRTPVVTIDGQPDRHIMSVSRSNE